MLMASAIRHLLRASPEKATECRAAGRLNGNRRACLDARLSFLTALVKSRPAQLPNRPRTSPVYPPSLLPIPRDNLPPCPSTASSILKTSPSPSASDSASAISPSRSVPNCELSFLASPSSLFFSSLSGRLYACRRHSTGKQGHWAMYAMGCGWGGEGGELAAVRTGDLSV